MMRARTQDGEQNCSGSQQKQPAYLAASFYLRTRGERIRSGSASFGGSVHGGLLRRLKVVHEDEAQLDLRPVELRR